MLRFQCCSVIYFWGGGIVYITHGGFCSQIVHMVFGLGIAGSQNFLTVNSQVSKEAEYPGFVG